MLNLKETILKNATGEENFEHFKTRLSALWNTTGEDQNRLSFLKGQSLAYISLLVGSDAKMDFYNHFIKCLNKDIRITFLKEKDFKNSIMEMLDISTFEDFNNKIQSNISSSNFNYEMYFKCALTGLYCLYKDADKESNKLILNMKIAKLRGVLFIYLRFIIPDVNKRLKYTNDYLGKATIKELGIYKTSPEFADEFIKSLETGKILRPTEPNCFDFVDISYKNISEEEYENIMNTFTCVKYTLNDMWICHPDYKWEMVCPVRKDSKYGRFMVDYNKKLYRKTTMGEFYGTSTVD